MSRALVLLTDDEARARARRWIDGVPDGTRLEFKKPRRTLPQNDRQWAMLTDIATQLAWHGRKLTTNQWKMVLLDALTGELDVVPNVDGTGFVSLGRSSSDLSKEETAEFIELIFAFGAQHNVVWSDPKEVAQRRQLEQRHPLMIEHKP